MTAPSWSLMDAAEIAAENKYTFARPGADLIGKLAVGEIVKLIFQSGDDDDYAAERMWVAIVSLDGKGGFQGRLENEPQLIEGLELGTLVEFRDIHIIDTEHEDKGESQALVSKYLVRCFVTNAILDDGARIGLLYREEPDNEDLAEEDQWKRDSGWRFMSGDETDEYMNDNGNHAYVSIGAVLRCGDDSFVHLLDAPVGTGFKRDPETGEFVPFDLSAW